MSTPSVVNLLEQHRGGLPHAVYARTVLGISKAHWHQIRAGERGIGYPLILRLALRYPDWFADLERIYREDILRSMGEAA